VTDELSPFHPNNVAEVLSPFHPERRLKLERTKCHTLAGPLVDRIQGLYRALHEDNDEALLLTAAYSTEPEGWTLHAISKKREIHTNPKPSIRETLIEGYYVLHREVFDLFHADPTKFAALIEQEANKPLDHDWFYSLEGSPDLRVQHLLKGTMVNQIKTMMRLAYDVHDITVYAESDIQKPEWWRIVALTAKSVLLKGDIQIKSEAVPTIVRGLHQIHSLLYTHLHNQQLLFAQTLEDVLKEGISGSWGFQEG